MDEVLKDWQRLSLTEEEGDRVVLEDGVPPNKEFIIAAKFMTRRALSIDAIGRTFKPLWKTRNGYQIRDVGNHIILFVFDDETEAERVLTLEPWSYDKHLVILNRYDGSYPIRSIKFHTVKFWIQIHGLPFNRLNEGTAYNIGKSLGVVSRAEQKGDIIGGDFLRIRVGINVSKPLCRGRKVLLGQGKEEWVSFKYEKLPNFCYWCGLVSHDDKECSIWLASKGALSSDQQGYGPWLRAYPYSTGKKSYMVVSGMGNDFGGDDIPTKSDGGDGAAKVATVPPSHLKSDQISNNPSVVNTDLEAPITHKSQAGIISSTSESIPCLDPSNMPVGTDLFEVQLQIIDQGLNKYNNHTSLFPDTRVMDTVSSSNINDIAQVQTQKSEALAISPTSPIISQEPEKNSETRDMSSVPPNLRTWKRMVRQNCMDEQTMHAQVTGKRSSEIGTDLVAPSSKKSHVLPEEGPLLYEMAEAVKQPRQMQ